MKRWYVEIDDSICAILIESLFLSFGEKFIYPWLESLILLIIYICEKIRLKVNENWDKEET